MKKKHVTVLLPANKNKWMKSKQSKMKNREVNLDKHYTQVGKTLFKEHLQET